jgi:hypothetical protein
MLNLTTRIETKWVQNVNDKVEMKKGLKNETLSWFRGRVWGGAYGELKININQASSAQMFRKVQAVPQCETKPARMWRDRAALRRPDRGKRSLFRGSRARILASFGSGR